MNFIKFYADFRPIAREKFVFKVQMWCRIRDDINYLGPVVKPRDDKFLSSFYSEIVFMFVVCLIKERKVCHPGA